MLEVGFGTGKALQRMRDLGWDVTGVDIDPVAVHAARARGLNVWLGDLAAQHFPAEHFDAIYLSHVIEHVHDPLALLAECHRTLRRDGELRVITPNCASLGHRRFRAAWFGLEPPRHLVMLSPASLREVARRAGFAEVSVRSSARIAAICWIAGADIRRHGRVVPADGALPAGRLARGLAAQVTQAVLLTVRPDVGEELVLSAHPRRHDREHDPRDRGGRASRRCSRRTSH
jgi:SAM-dependent methyltransferase